MNNNKRYSIEVLDESFNVVKTYASMSEAVRDGYRRDSILRSLNNPKVRYKGFKFRKIGNMSSEDMWQRIENGEL